MSDITPNGEPTPDPTPEPTPPPVPEATPTPASEPAAQPTSSGPATPSQTPSSSEAIATLKAANPLDLTIIGLGLLTFIASLLPYYTVSAEIFGSSSSSSANAWHGFFGWFGALCALSAAALLVVRLLGIALPIPVRTVVLGLFGLAALCTLLALFVIPGGKCDDSGLLGSDVCDLIDQGHGVGYWLALLATIGGTAVAALRRTAD